jgi:non-ribosomal peptide synthetase component F
MVKKTSEAMSACVEHAVVPFVKVVEAVDPARDASRTPIFQTMMVWHQVCRWAEHGKCLAGLQAVGGKRKDSVLDAKFETLLNMADQDSNGVMQCSIEYNSDLYDQSSIERMAAHLRNLSQQLVQYPDRPMSELHMLSAEEERQVLEVWNATSQKWRETSTAQELLEEQAKALPTSVAVHFEGTASLSIPLREPRSQHSTPPHGDQAPHPPRSRRRRHARVRHLARRSGLHGRRLRSG